MTDFETPDQQFLELAGDVPSSLAELKETIESTVSIRSLDQLTEYCTNRNIDFASWRADELSEDQLAKIGEAFSKMLPGVNIVEYLSMGTDTEEYKGSKEILTTIVDILVEREHQKKELFEGREQIGEDATVGFLGDVVDKYKGAMADHPVLATGALVVAAVLGYNMLQAEFEMPFTGQKRKWFKDLAMLGGLAWAGNFITEAITDKSIIENVQDLLSKDDEGAEFEGMVERMPLSQESKDSMSNSFRLGSIPFKYFLAAYEHARDNHTYAIDMNTIRNNKYGRKLPSNYFRERHGEALYKEMESLVSDDIEGFRDNYNDRAEETGRHGYYSLHEVLFMELYPHTGDVAASDVEDDEDSDVAAGTTSGATSGRSKKKAGSSKEKAPALSATAAALTSHSEFERLSPDFGSPMRIMGFPFSHKEETFDDGVTQHLFTDSADKRFSINVSPDMDEHEKEALVAECAEIESYLRSRMDAAFPRLDMAPKYEPKWEDSEWLVTPSFEIDGRYFKLKLEIDDDRLLLVTPEGEKGETIHDIIPLLVQSETVRGLRDQMARDPKMNFLSRLPIENVNTRSNPKTGLIGGAPFKFQWDPTAKSYRVYDVDVNGRLNDKLIDEATRVEFGDVFKNLDRLPDSNAFMDGLIKFKKAQILEDYREALEDLPDVASVDQIHAVYKEYVEDRAKELSRLTDQLTMDFDAHEEEFMVYGFGREYADRFTAFSTFARGLDLKGHHWSDKHNELALAIMQIWYDKTKAFRGVSDLSQTHLTYLEDFERVLKAEIERSAEKKLWGADRVITKESVALTLSQVSSYPSYDEKYGEFEEHIAAVFPSLKGLEGKYTTDTSDPTKVEFTFEDGTVWVFNVATQALVQFELTDDLIAAKVLALNSDPDFNAAFDNMRYIFDSMEGNDITWANVRSFNIRSLFGGTVADNEWQELIDFKQEEARIHYRQDLQTAALQHAGNPAALETAVRQIDARRGQNSYGQYEAFANDMMTWIDNKMSKKETFTADEFESVYKVVAGFGYGNDNYATHMGRFRSQLELADYSGSEGLGERTPHEVLNKFMLLHEKYTGGLRNVPAGSWTKVHDAYMTYVRFRIMAADRRAHENGVRATGTFFDNVIGADEVPEGIYDLLTFEEYEEKYGTSIRTSTTTRPLDPASWDDLKKLLEELNGKPPTPSPGGTGGGGTAPGTPPSGPGTAPSTAPSGAPATSPEIQAWADAIQLEFDNLFNPWESTMRAGITNNDLQYERATNNLFYGEDLINRYWVDIVHDPSKKDQYLKEYEKDLEALYDDSEKTLQDRAVEFGKWLIPGW